MKTGLFFVLFFLSYSHSVFSSEKYLLLPESIAPVTRELLPNQLIYTERGVSIIQVDEDFIETISESIHQKLGGCGGFIDVTEEVEMGVSPFKIVWNEIERKDSPSIRSSFEVRGDEMIVTLVKLVSIDSLWNTITELSNMPDRSAKTDYGKQASEFLYSKAQANGKGLAGFSVRKIVTSSYPKQPSVVATLNGLNPSLEHIVIGAHMDTLSSNKPGADDDASGSALVMETLRVIQKSGATFEHTIDFVWYSAEELGLVGSSSVVNQFKKDNITVKAAIQFDMVGYRGKGDTEDIYLITDYTNAPLNEALSKIIKLYTTAKVGETKCGYACSDHANWTRAGIPATFPFEARFGNDNPDIHKSTDKIEYLKKDLVFLFAQTATAFLGEIAKLKSINVTSR